MRDGSESPSRRRPRTCCGDGPRHPGLRSAGHAPVGRVAARRRGGRPAGRGWSSWWSCAVRGSDRTGRQRAAGAGGHALCRVIAALLGCPHRVAGPAAGLGPRAGGRAEAAAAADRLLHGRRRSLPWVGLPSSRSASAEPAYSWRPAPARRSGSADVRLYHRHRECCTAVPAYQTLADDLRAQITSGRLRPGDRLPTEPQLWSAHRGEPQHGPRGPRLLASQHLIVTTRGVAGGSFVAHPTPSQLSETLATGVHLLQASSVVGLADLLEARRAVDPAVGRPRRAAAQPGAPRRRSGLPVRSGGHRSSTHGRPASAVSPALAAGVRQPAARADQPAAADGRQQPRPGRRLDLRFWLRVDADHRRDPAPPWRPDGSTRPGRPPRTTSSICGGPSFRRPWPRSRTRSRRTTWHDRAGPGRPSRSRPAAFDQADLGPADLAPTRRPRPRARSAPARRRTARPAAPRRAATVADTATASASSRTVNRQVSAAGSGGGGPGRTAASRTPRRRRCGGLRSRPG